MEQPFRIVKADHTGFSVHSLDLALPFWTDVLGFQLLRTGVIEAGEFLGNVCAVRDHGLRFALLEARGHTVELLEYVGGAPRGHVDDRSEAIGATHLCLTLDDLDAALPVMAAHGWKARGVPQTLMAGPRAGTRVVYVTGPDAINIELMQPPS